MDEIKRMNIKEFRELGLLAELNRSFLHPLGLALEVIIDDDGTQRLGGIWDCRDEPEGILYGENTLSQLIPNIQNAQEFIQEKHRQRYETLGYIYQDINIEGEPNE